MMAFVCVLRPQHTHAALQPAHPPHLQARAGVEPALSRPGGYLFACTCRQPFLDNDKPARVKG